MPGRTPIGRFGRMTRNCHRNRRGLGAGILAILLIQPIAPMALVGSAGALAENDLGLLSIEDLLDLEVTSVSKRPQKLSEAPAAVTVVTFARLLHPL